MFSSYTILMQYSEVSGIVEDVTGTVSTFTYLFGILLGCFIVLLILLFLGVIILLIYLNYNKRRKDISLNSKPIKNKKELGESLKFWREELGVNKKSIILLKLLGPLDGDYKLAKKYGGAFADADKIKNNTYKVGIIFEPKSANEGAFVHELLHIKLGHCDKEKKIFYKMLMWITFTLLKLYFEIEANKELIKYEDLLLKRKNSG